ERRVPQLWRWIGAPADGCRILVLGEAYDGIGGAARQVSQRSRALRGGLEIDITGPADHEQVLRSGDGDAGIVIDCYSIATLADEERIIGINDVVIYRLQRRSHWVLAVCTAQVFSGGVAGSCLVPEVIACCGARHVQLCRPLAQGTYFD